MMFWMFSLALLPTHGYLASLLRACSRSGFLSIITLVMSRSVQKI
jgi:hypothetical protein